MSDSSSSSQGKQNMKRYSFRMPPSLIEAAKKKAGIVPLSGIIRKLIEMWVRGEIEVDYSEDTEGD